VADLNNLKKQIEDLRKQYSDLTKKPAALFNTDNLKDANAAIDTLNKAIADAKKEAASLEAGFGGIDSTIKSIVSELKKGNEASSLATKAFRGIQNITEKLKYDQQDISKLSLDQLKRQRDKLKTYQQEIKDQSKIISEKIQGLTLDKKGNQLEGEALRSKLDELKLNHQINESEIAIYMAAKENFAIFEETNQLLKERIEKEEKINSKIGLAGKLMKGLAKIPIVGQFIDTNEALEKMRDKVEKTGSSIAALGAGLKSVGKDIFKGAMDPLTTIVLIVNAMKELDGGAEKFARSMNMSYKESLQFRNEMEKVNGVTKGQMQESVAFINKQLGTSSGLTKEMRAEFTQLEIRAGMTKEELMGITSLSLTNGKTIKQNTNAFMAQVKHIAAGKNLVLNEKQLMGDISKISAATTLSLGKNPKELAKAVATAKALGIEMNKLESIADGLLNFEQSIEAELSAELLTGKNLNLEKARQAALNNDIAGMAEEINKQIGNSAEYTKMNRIQQESLAKAVGMNREELAQTLYTQEQLKGATGKEAEEKQALLDKLIQEKGLTEAKRLMETEGFEKLKQQAGVQTEFNQSILELKGILADGILPMFKGIAEFVRDHMNMIKAIAAIYLGMKITFAVLNTLNLVGLAIDQRRKRTAEKESGTEVVGNAFKIGGSLGPYGIAIIAGLIATGLASLAMFTGDDIMSPAPGGTGYGKRTLFGPEGAIQLNDKDTVIAGTNLFGNDIKSEPGKATQMGKKGEIKLGGDSSAVVNAIMELRKDVNALANRPIIVQMDGKEIAKVQGKYPNEAGDANRSVAYKVH
jgi:hypothetical protein